MTTFILCTLFVLIPALLLYSAVIAFKRMSSGKSPKKALRFNIGVFAALICAVALTSGFGLCRSGNRRTCDDCGSCRNRFCRKRRRHVQRHGTSCSRYRYRSCRYRRRYCRSCRCACAIAATSEDPKSFGKSIIFVALGESIALYGVVIAILILQKV